MENLTISKDDFESYLLSSNPLSDLIEQARKAIDSGGNFIIKDAVAPGEDGIVSTHEELDELIEAVDPISTFPKEDSRYFLLKNNSIICEIDGLNIIHGKRPTLRFNDIGGGSFQAKGRPSPTIIKFSCDKILSLNGHYSISNHKYDVHHLIIKNTVVQNNKTLVEGYKTN